MKMDGCTDEMMNTDDERSSFGIKKIVDVKLREDGKQMFKVEWQPTWEPVENLASCQHLIDKFWSFVNKAKVNEENAKKYHKTPTNGNPITNMSGNITKLSKDDKLEVQRLIATTNSTLVPPNEFLNQQNHKNDNAHLNFQNSSQNSTVVEKPVFNSPIQKTKNPVIPKSETGFSPGGGVKEQGTNSASLKYVENFENPYVKIILVCKICNKEQSLKFSHTWKRHYLSHASNEEKPHKCPYCPKAFVRLAQKKQHLKTHQNSLQQPNVIEEQQIYDMHENN